VAFNDDLTVRRRIIFENGSALIDSRDGLTVAAIIGSNVRIDGVPLRADSSLAMHLLVFKD
jgi:hypothetical protein